MSMTLLLLVFCFSAFFHDASALASDGVTLLSLLTHWTFAPPPINSSWNASDSIPCSWVGVQCDHAHNVVSLNLTDQRIFGQLGPQIGQLYHLQTLVLSSNGFSGKVPSELSNCSLLKYLDLSENSFSGQIPYSFKNLQNLWYMSLSSNLLTGEIPDSLFQIPQLEEVSLHNNLLSGPIPTNIGNMTELLRLYLYGNQLSGTIPLSIGNCSKLEALFFNDNRLNGILPETLHNLKNLVYFDVRNNSLGGTIPLGSGCCKRLFVLDLSLNVFSGGIPSGLGNCSGLAELSAVNSNLVGSIPSSLGLLRELSILRLPENHLSGKIPPEIGNCRSLKKLHLYSNQLEGEIPDKLGMLSELEDLELSFNHLMGEIPVSIWRIQSLKHILVHNNSLFGELPLEMTELRHLKNISLFDNQFSGVIPQSLGVNSSLVKLDFMNNRFTGDIPPNLCFGKQLRVLNVGLNQLQGGIPSDVGRCATLGRLILNENNFSGSIPDFESNPNLRYMDISKNNISGPIPSSLENCTNITAINLSMNRFTGLIPSELGKLVNLVILDLAHNNLEGPLPPQLSNCTAMDHFDVGFNFLNGSLPSSLRNWTRITTLILRENHFSGGIPDFLSEFNNLRELQLGGNLFGGKIPRSIGTLQNLFYGLNLSANGLTGEIPLEIKNLGELQSLDVSLNNLTGTIDVLGDLVSLIEANISYNFFNGSVPKLLMKLLNSSPSSFVGNPHLCVICSPSHALSCIETRYLKPCVHKSTDHIGISKFVIVVIELGSSICISAMLIMIIGMYLRRRSKQESNASNSDEARWSRSFIERGGGKIGFIYKQQVKISAEKQLFSLHDLVMKATENLNDQYIIGRGAHGIVYKAQLGPRQAFAVKKVVFGRHKEKRLSVMLTEIQTLGMIKHRNLVTYGDYWFGEDYGLILLEYMENGSLHDILHEKNPPPPLRWNVRFKIAVGIAQGLEYLHYDCIPPIVHRDIKPKNILLDADMEPLIADFGIALRRGRHEHSKSCQPRQTLSAYVAGTVGYIAPENAYAIVPSRKSDVYSYGVVLLELLTRKKILVPSLKDKEQETHLVSWARSIWLETGEIEKIVDPDLAIAFSYSVVVAQQVTEVLMLALRCTERDARKRQKMRDVINFYQRAVFKVRCDNVDYGTGVVTDVAPQPCDHHLHGESSRAANLRQAVHSSLVGFRFEKKNTYSSLQDLVLEATDDLNDCYIIGRAAHGIFYKAQVGPQLVLAVKMVAFGRDKKKNISIMLKEIQTIRMMKHPNLVTYADCWIGQFYGLILYEYMENGSLHDILHEKCPTPFLTWNVRLKIAVGIAHGLAHLHNDCVLPIVHGDIKSKNILLDVDMEPLIADFRTAQQRFINCCNSDSDCQHRQVLSIFVDGNQAMVQDKAYADVYSYGVVLLELLTRKKVFVPSFKDEEEQVTTFVSWVRSVWVETRGKIEKIVDSDLASAFSDSVIVAKQVTAVLMLALRCTYVDQWKRPTMKDVVNFYQRPMFKERWDNVVHGTEVAAEAAPQPCNSLSLCHDIPVVSINSVSNTQGKVTFNVETEPEDSNDFTWWQDADQYERGVYAWDDWKLMSRPTTGIEGLVIKLMGNVKIQAKQVLVAALIIPKITYSWPYLIFLPSEIGPVFTKPFNWFFLSRWAQYMHLQKSLYAQPKSCFITPIKATLQLS